MSTKTLVLDGDKIPEVDQNSLEFLARIVKNDLRFVEFDENLSIFSQVTEEEVGSLIISVQPFVYKRNNCFKILFRSFYKTDVGLFTTEVNALVDHQLNTIEQEYYQYSLSDRGESDIKSIITFDETTNEFVLQKKTIDNTELEVRIKKYLMNGFISESANIILQRLMIQSKYYPDKIRFFTFDFDLNPAQFFYSELDDQIVKIGDQEIEIKGLKGTVVIGDDVRTTWQVYLSSDGHVINRVEAGLPLIARALHKPSNIEIDDYLPKITIPKKDINWENDMQFRSKYQDRKEELKNDYDQYLKDHPEVKSLMADFMQSVLIAKPNDVVSYSARYFAPYATNTTSNQLLSSYSTHVNIPKH